ncbi:glycoside hydrolase family 30 protein [Granulicella arctica]|uniref:Glucosylceramidase n=1 Tax=Granulicella arctica TaxID=940613 RepID=A0A7Y9PGP7_9BACT|nr:glycoside hydrolase family 30 beta sandwich domain-containing protein [Granulicella arctica]NYF79567.1 glucosylceramidase [Granulicella arctica]
MKPHKRFRPSVKSSAIIGAICFSVFPLQHSLCFAQTVQVYETTANGSNLLAQQNSVTFSSGGGTGSYTITVSPSQLLQSWDGVGAALTDSASTVIAAVPASQQTTVLQQLFSPSIGIGLNIVRLPMGASDMSASGNYSYDDVPAGETDPNLTSFSIAHDLTNTIPLLQSIASINSNLKVIAVPWSPPAWMKTNGSMDGVSGASTATSQIIISDFPVLASYFVKFAQAYAAQNVPIYALSAQNEPLNTQSGYPSAILTASDEATFIANDLGPSLSTAGLSSIKIFGLEDNWSDTSYAQTLLQSSAASYLAGTSFHWYNGSPSAMSTVQALNTTLGTWLTETTGTVSCPNGAGTCPVLSASTFSASGFKTQMQQIIMGSIQNSGRGALGWNLALNQNEGPQNGGCYNCVGLVTINNSVSPAAIYYNTTYYVLGHVGKFVTPGASVIGTTTQGSTGIQDVGFLNPDGSVVVVVFNAASSTQTFNIAEGSESFTYTLPSGAAASFKWSPN